MKTFGLIGKSLSHSFSSSYFNEKFFKERLKDLKIIKLEANNVYYNDPVYNMVEIPFLLWGSNTFEISESDLKRKFSLNDLSHSIADLCNVYSMDLDPKRSIFNHSFVERPRIVRDTILVK